jgi:hypothetical protein
MKKMHHIIMMLLILFAVTAAIGQDSQGVPKRTPQEQAAFEQAIPVNPARIAQGQIMDPKMDPSQAVEPPVRWKAEEAPLEAGKSPMDMPEEIKPVHPDLPHSAATTQPEAQKFPGNPFPYRDIKGSPEQVPGTVTAPAFQYRDRKGPSEQPVPQTSPK